MKTLKNEQAGARRQREVAQRREEILEAAETVFAEKGFANCSMEEIARQAEFAVGTIYNFFKNKEALYSEILEQKSAEISPRLTEALEGPGTPKERLMRHVQARLDVLWEHRRFFRLFFHHTMNTFNDPRPGMTACVCERYQNTLRLLEKVCAEGIEAGEFASVCPGIMAQCVDGMCRGYLVMLSRADAPERKPETERMLLDLVLHGVARRS